MPLLHQHRFSELDPSSNPNVYYIYMENYKKQGGDIITKTLRGSQNSLSLTVKKAHGKTINTYWDDSDFPWLVTHLDKEFDNIERVLNINHTVVFLEETVNSSVEYNEDYLKKKSKKLHNYIKDRWRRIISSYEPKKIYATTP